MGGGGCGGGVVGVGGGRLLVVNRVGSHLSSSYPESNFIQFQACLLRLLMPRFRHTLYFGFYVCQYVMERVPDNSNMQNLHMTAMYNAYNEYCFCKKKKKEPLLQLFIW